MKEKITMVIKISKFTTSKKEYEEGKNDKYPTMKKGYTARIDDGHCITSFGRPTLKKLWKHIVEEVNP